MNSGVLTNTWEFSCGVPRQELLQGTGGSPALLGELTGTARPASLVLYHLTRLLVPGQLQMTRVLPAPLYSVRTRSTTWELLRNAEPQAHPQRSATAFPAACEQDPRGRADKRRFSRRCLCAGMPGAHRGRTSGSQTLLHVRNAREL